MKRLAIIGSALSGGAEQIIEALQGNTEYVPEMILDSDTTLKGKKISGVLVQGTSADVLELWKKGMFDAAVIAIGGDLNERKRLFDYLVENGIATANVVDSSVKFGMGVKVGTGNVILNNSYLGNYTVIGNNNYILNQCSIQHNSSIGDHNYFATNVTVGAKVHVGNENRFKIKCVIETSSVIANKQVINTCEIIKNS